MATPRLDILLERFSVNFTVSRYVLRDSENPKHAIAYAKASAMADIDNALDKWRKENNYHGKVVLLLGDWDITKLYTNDSMYTDDYDEKYTRHVSIYAEPTVWGY